MKKTVFTLLFIFIANNFANAQNYQVHMTLSFSDCLNCVQFARNFGKIPAILNPKMVFREQDKRVAKQYLEKQLTLNIEDKQIIYSDSLFLALNKGELAKSFVHISWKDQVEKSIKLTNFTLADLQPFLTVSFKNTKILPSSVFLGDGLVLKSNEKHFFLLDTQFSQMYVFNNQYQLIRTFDKKTFNKKDIYKRIYGDTVGFYKKITSFEKQLGEVGKTDVVVVDCFFDKTGRVFLELLMYYAEHEKGDNIGVKPITLVVEWEKDNIKNEKFHNFKINKPIFFKDNDYYGLLNGFAFDIVGKEAYVMNAHIKPDSANTIFISKLKIQNTKDKKTGLDKGFYFDGFTKLKFPVFAIKSKTEYMFVAGKLIYPFYFFGFENLVGNIETGEYSLLNDLKFNNDYKELLKTFNFDYQFVDIKSVSKNQYRYLVNFKGVFFLYNFDVQSQKSTLYKEIALPNKKNFISQPVLLNSNTIWVISTDNELIEISF